MNGKILFLTALVANAALLPTVAVSQQSAPDDRSDVIPESDPPELDSLLDVIPVSDAPVPEPTVAAPKPSAPALEEIVVTAQKRASGLQDAPMSITAIGGSELSFRAINSATDLQFQVPGMNVAESGGNTLISLRGIGMNIDAGNVEPGVALHIDGAYQPRPSTGPLGLEDLDRVEVLRGPQGTLYGRNSSGGVANFILKKPTDSFEGTIKLGIGNYDRRKIVGILSGPLIDETLLGRLVLLKDEDGGYVEDVASGKMTDPREGESVRGALTWIPTDAISVDLSVLRRDDEGGGLAPRDVMRNPPNPEKEMSAAAYSPLGTTRPDQYVVGEPWKKKLNYLPDGERSTTNATLGITWQGDYFGVSSLTGYQEHENRLLWDVDLTTNNATNIPEPGFSATSESLQQELIVSFSSESFDGLIGAYYFTEDYIPYLPAEAPQAALGLGIEIELFAFEKTDSIAIFTDFSYALTDRLRLLGGLRALRDEKSTEQYNRYWAGGIPLPTVPGALTTCEGLRLTIKSEKLTPKVGLQWDVADNISTYAQYAVGYKSGGTNFAACGDTYEPEEVKAVEVGLKSDWFDRRLVANLSVFDNKYTNFQIARTETLSAFITNAPKARITGGELELTALVTQAWQVTAAVSVLDARYEEFSDSDPVYPERGEQNLEGVELSRAPDYTATLGVEYSWELPWRPIQHWRLRGEWYTTADQVYRPYGGPHDGQKSYELFNAYLSVISAGERFNLNIFGKNLQNTAYFLHSAGGGTELIVGSLGEPRMYGVELSYSFQ